MGCTSSQPAPKQKKKAPNPVAVTFTAQGKGRGPLVNYDDESQIIALDDVTQLSREDYGELTFVQSGAFGKVYRTTRLSDGKVFAMKFFGYVAKQPRLAEIDKEIGLMHSLKGIPNVVQIEGIFMDSAEGYVADRESDQPFPVIVMEALQGGDLFDRIHDKGGKITEKYLATAFRGVVEALRDTHQRCFVHRDLKLENLMYATKDPDSAIKLIDFGMMMKILEPTGIFVGLHVEGTPGYCAPESLTKKQYTAKSDVWQAGCCLYSLLSGLAAFATDRPDLVIEAKYAPMAGLAWNSISDNAKDLVQKILVKDPNVRLSTFEILEHPWLQEGGAPEQELDAGYTKRIRKLALVHKMRTLFSDVGIQESSKLRRQSLVAALPFLDETMPFNEGPRSPEGIASFENNDRMFFQKLKLLKSGVLYAVSPFAVNEDTKHRSRRTRRTNSFHADDHEEEDADRISVLRRTSDSSMFMKNHSSWKDFDLAHITYPDYVSILHKVDLRQLANRQVFDIFDNNHSGFVDMKEFLFAILAFHPQHSSASNDLDAAHLFFNFFDVKESGFINMEDLKLVVGCLLAEEIETNPQITAGNVEELFHTIDQDHKGKISFEEFKTFYETVLKSKTASSNSIV